MKKLNLKRAQKRADAREQAKAPRGRAGQIKCHISRVWRYPKLIYPALVVAAGTFAYVLGLPKLIGDFGDYYPKATKYVEELFYSPSEWSGIFDAFPEGRVDINDLRLSSPVKAALELEVYDGNKLDGRIWWQGSCDLGMPHKGILISGDIEFGGSTANVEVFDFSQGRRVSFFTGKLENHESIIQFSEFPADTGLNGSRIAKNPLPSQLKDWGEPYCAWFLDLMRQTQ
ncbi:hypothetical protein RA2_03002 [Roseovarius sp. A-2]|uniref:hypothetical protein n=1 Tax=Roseovarius sp. A-2 TaxID=1570360 RepID=UPI0009D15E47|nr:hypothetical protein [Roseovarius sp. A-2]GAW35934.1 hypothetical protein RA2_03002 [Roseovarius sp. A-2]